MSGAAPRRSSLLNGIMAFAFGGLVVFLLFQAWNHRGNLLPFGWGKGEEETIEKTEVLEKIQSFVTVTAKYVVNTQAQSKVPEELNVLGNKITIPRLIAGQDMKVRGRLDILAGVDLSGKEKEDKVQIDTRKQNGQTLVVITVPAPTIMAATIRPETFKIDESPGFLNRIAQGAGVEQSLQDSSVGLLQEAAKKEAIESGILNDAAQEFERRLEDFLNSIEAQVAKEQKRPVRVTYDVIVRAPEVQ